MTLLDEGYRRKKIVRLIFEILLIMYLCYLTYLVFFSHYYGRGSPHQSINYIPFKTILLYLRLTGCPGIVMTNILGNVVAFIPMGFLLPVVFRSFGRLGNLLLGVLIATSLVEVTQYIAGVGAFDVDDIILNVLGGILGYVAFVFLRLFWELWANRIE